MNRYTIYCTEEQTKKALELGAPIRYKDTLDNRERGKFEPPTAEQMLGWLNDQGVSMDTDWSWDGQVTIWGWYNQVKEYIYTSYANSLKEAILAAIDAALEYLMNNKK